jgi:hypothetical protein
MRSRQESGVREIRMRRSIGRGLETGALRTAPALDPTASVLVPETAALVMLGALRAHSYWTITEPREVVRCEREQQTTLSVEEKDGKTVVTKVTVE